MKYKILVVGGTSGIGEEVALMAERLDRPWVDAIKAVGEESCDVTDFTAVLNVVEDFRPTHVVYSAGTNHLKWIKDICVDDFENLLRVNVIGFQYLLTALCDAYGGTQPVSVVAVSSDAAQRPMRTSLMYCASKAALTMAVRCAARELGTMGWRINSVSPGKVADTGMTRYVDAVVPGLRGWTEEYARSYELASSPLNRYLRKSEVADVVLDVLFGPQALNGADIVINGGR